MHILLTAFEPFGGEETNITQSVLSLLPDSIADWALEKVCLPVSFKRAPIVLREAIATYTPDLVIMLGQCPAGENIRLERFAVNMMDSTKGDNDGYIPNEETIYVHQPLAPQTPLPIKELVRFCTDHVQPAQVSNSEDCMSATVCIMKRCISNNGPSLCTYPKTCLPACLRILLL